MLKIKPLDLKFPPGPGNVISSFTGYALVRFLKSIASASERQSLIAHFSQIEQNSDRKIAFGGELKLAAADRFSTVMGSMEKGDIGGADSSPGLFRAAGRNPLLHCSEQRISPGPITGRPAAFQHGKIGNLCRAGRWIFPFCS